MEVATIFRLGWPRDTQLHDAIVEEGGHCGELSVVGQREAANERSGGALDAHVSATAEKRRPCSSERKDPFLCGHLNVFRVEAGQIYFNQVIFGCPDHVQGWEPLAVRVQVSSGCERDPTG